MLIDIFEPRLARDGCLEFTFSGYGKTVGRFTPWSNGFETLEIKYDRTREKPFWCLQVLPHRKTSPPGAKPHRFFSDIPDEIGEQVRRFQLGQCVMLRWIARYPAARDLCHSNPKLLWLLATAIYDSNINEAEIPSLLRKKQIDIMAMIIKPSSSSMLRLLQKVAIDSGDLKEARMIIRALKNPNIRKILKHQGTIPITLLKTIYDNPELAIPSVASFLAENLGNSDFDPAALSRHVSDTLADIRRMAEVLGIDNPSQAIARCSSIEDLESLHDRWIDRVNRDHGLWLTAGLDEWPEGNEPPQWFGLGKDVFEKLRENDWALPDPPFPGNKAIRAIRSVHELIGEGRIQKNCVATRAVDILSGEAFVYKVLRPHRATLELIKRKDGWEIGELKLSCNRPPGPEVLRVVNEWFANRADDIPF